MVNEKKAQKKYIANALIWLFCVLGIVTGGHSALAQGSVSGVAVTTSVSSVSIPVTTATSYSASVTDGTPQPAKEWKVIGSASYSWSASLGTPSPNNTSETTVTTVSFNQAINYTSTVSCTVSYQVQKSDPGQSDDGQTATISGSGSASVTINVGDFTISGPGDLTIPQGSSGGASVTVTRINGLTGTIYSNISDNSRGGVTYQANAVPNSDSASWTVNVSSSAMPPPKNGHYTITVTATCGSLTHTTTGTLKITSVQGVNISGPVTAGPVVSMGGNGTPQQDPNGNPLYVPKTHLRVPDGSMAGDYGIDLVTVDGKDGTAAGSAPFYPNVSYTEQPYGYWSGMDDQDAWSSTDEGSPTYPVNDSSTGSTLNADYFGDYYYVANYDLHPSQKNPGNFGTDNISVTRTDGMDGTTASNSFTMTTHEAYEAYYDDSHSYVDTNNETDYQEDRSADSPIGTSASNPEPLQVVIIKDEPFDAKVSFSLHDLPIPWINLIPIDVDIPFHSTIPKTSAVATVTAKAPLLYTYLVAYPDCTNHDGENLHYTDAGFVGESGFNFTVTTGVSLTVHEPIQDTGSGGGGQPSP